MRSSDVFQCLTLLCSAQQFLIVFLTGQGSPQWLIQRTMVSPMLLHTTRVSPVVTILNKRHSSSYFREQGSPQSLLHGTGDSSVVTTQNEGPPSGYYIEQGCPQQQLHRTWVASVVTMNCVEMGWKEEEEEEERAAKIRI